MYILSLPFTFLEIAIFSMAVFVFLLTVRFFMASQRNLENLLPNTKKIKSRLPVSIDQDGFIVPTNITHSRKTAVQHKLLENNEVMKNEIKELRGMMQLQQLELTRAIRQIEKFTKNEKSFEDDEDYVNEEEEHYTGVSNLEIEELELKLEKKEAELKELRQQGELNNKLQGHFEEVQSGYEELQLKVQKMEQQAWQVAELAIKLDSLEQSNEQLEKTMLKKEEKIRELTVESSRMHEMLNETEDKLSEANLQRQQLTKKVQFLEEINSDIQQMSDANRKLKNELRRVAELESMLNLITEERDALLKRRSTRF